MRTFLVVVHEIYIYIDFTVLGPGVYLYAFLIWTTDFEGPFRRESRSSSCRSLSK